MVLAGVSGCAGPAHLKGTRPGYNQAVQQTDSKELLLNLVRLRYGEPMQFLLIGAINSTFQYQATAGANITIPEGPPMKVYGTQLGFALGEAPIVSYQPLGGARFAQQTQKEMSVATLVLLLRGGWNIERVMRVAVERLGNLRNSPELPDYKKFLQLVRLWRSVQARGDLNFVRLSPAKFPIITALEPELKEQTDPVLILRIEYANQAEADQADALLGITPRHIKLPDGKVLEGLKLIDPLEALTPPASGKIITEIPVWLRSFAGQLLYAALGVEVPAGAQDRVRVYADPEGKPVDPRTALRDLIDIRSSGPGDAFVSVNYRGEEFYIDDRDQQSKETFHLLSVIFALQSELTGSQPLLTIPVGGPSLGSGPPGPGPSGPGLGR